MRNKCRRQKEECGRQKCGVLTQDSGLLPDPVFAQAAAAANPESDLIQLNPTESDP